MKKVFVHLAEGFEEVEALAVVDVLRRAAIDVTMVSITGNLMVTGVHNITVKADTLFEEADYSVPDMLFLPGGIPGSTNLEKHEGLRQQIMAFNKAGKYLSAICAAPLVFGKLGLLADKQACCYPGFEATLTNAKVITDATAVANHIITGRGVGVVFEFALLLVEILVSKAVADDMKTKMLVQ